MKGRRDLGADGGDDERAKERASREDPDLELAGVLDRRQLYVQGMADDVVTVEQPDLGGQRVADGVSFGIGAGRETDLHARLRAGGDQARHAIGDLGRFELDPGHLVGVTLEANA